MIGGDDLSFFKKCTRSMYIYFDAAGRAFGKRKTGSDLCLRFTTLINREAMQLSCSP